jgi:hypothetical protein
LRCPNKQNLDFLRANFARLDRVDTRLDDMTTRIGTQRDVASLSLRITELKVDSAAMQNRLDTVDRRIARPERRLQLVEVPTSS